MPLTPDASTAIASMSIADLYTATFPLGGIGCTDTVTDSDSAEAARQIETLLIGFGFKCELHRARVLTLVLLLMANAAPSDLTSS